MKETLLATVGYHCCRNNINMKRCHELQDNICSSINRTAVNGHRDSFVGQSTVVMVKLPHVNHFIQLQLNRVAV